MPEFRTLFLICSERSGSNLIRVLMDAHPAVSAPPPLHFVRDVIARADALGAGAGDTEVTAAMLHTLEKRLQRYFTKAQAKDIFDEAMAVGAFSPRDLLRSVYAAVAGQTGAQLLMVKENELHRSAAQIIDAFPQAQFVFQVRDPRDYLASAIALRSTPFGNKFGSFRNAMQVWEDDQRFGLRMLGHFGRSRVFFQRYEDLVSDTENVLRRLCAFAGLDFVPEMLDFHEDTSVQTLSEKNKAWENLSRPIMSGNFNKYREQLSGRQIRAIEAMLGPLMERFGYTLETPAKQAGRWSLVWPSLSEPVERHFNKVWSPFYSLQNVKHHETLDRLAAPIVPDYASSAPVNRAGSAPRTVVERILDAARSRPDGTALIVDGKAWSYSRLLRAAAQHAKRLPGEKPVVAVYAPRHASSYIAILAVLLAGGTYVPLNCRFPAARNRDIVVRSGATCMFHGHEFSDAIAEILDGTSVDGLAIDLNTPEASEQEWEPRLPAPEDRAYILFTSGSTGRPKGVPISHRNLAAYVDNATALINPRPEDRFSQTFDLTFDLSVHDLMVAWSAGATLCVASLSDLMDASRYITRNEITQWFCVPSLAYTMRLAGSLEPGAFPSIRTSLFCGEPLPADIAQAWQAAAPRATVENWYGPTETTIACLRHAVSIDDNTGIVPIGRPFDGVAVLVIGEDGREVPEGEIGLLHLGGPQVAAGYLSDPEKTAAAFVSLPGQEGRFYCTGDLVSRQYTGLHFHGRNDSQSKIRGYRVEIGEIETALREQADGCNVVALTWPHGATNATHVVAAIETDRDTPRIDRRALSAWLPDYMMPVSVFGMSSFPKNASGKVDRMAIARAIEARIAARGDTPDGTAAERVLSAILSVKPSLDKDVIVGAENLLEAGLDSMDFVRLTIEFEDKFGVSLSEGSVARMANLTYFELVSILERGREAAQALANIPEKKIARANRAIAFVGAFPAIVARTGVPLVLAFGSSGTMRGIDTYVADATAREHGHRLRVLNIGLPALSAKGLERMSRFIADTCGDRKVAAVLHELDPMLVSTLPPKGDIALDEAIYASEVTARRKPGSATELDWAPETGGTLAAGEAVLPERKLARWEQERYPEIIAAYQGEVEFDADAVAAWVSACKTLKRLGAPNLGWVHPIKGIRAGGDRFEELLKQAKRATGLSILHPNEFDIDSDLFLNPNHVKEGAGMQVLTEILMRHLLAEMETPGTQTT